MIPPSSWLINQSKFPSSPCCIKWSHLCYCSCSIIRQGSSPCNPLCLWSSGEATMVPQDAAGYTTPRFMVVKYDCISKAAPRALLSTKSSASTSQDNGFATTSKPHTYNNLKPYRKRGDPTLLPPTLMDDLRQVLEALRNVGPNVSPAWQVLWAVCGGCVVKTAPFVWCYKKSCAPETTYLWSSLQGALAARILKLHLEGRKVRLSKITLTRCLISF